MLQAEGAEAPVKVEFDNFEHGFPEGFGPGGWGHLAYAIGIAFAVFQLVRRRLQRICRARWCAAFMSASCCCSPSA